MRLHSVIALLALVVSCQSSGHQRMPRGCPDWPNETGAVVPIKRVPPRYPAEAVRKSITGFVELEAEIDRSGRVISAIVVRSEPAGVFDRSVLQAYHKWRYCPLDDDAPDYPSPVQVRFPFAL